MGDIKAPPVEYHGWKPPGIKVWCCPPAGCGRLYLEGSGAEIEGTWYQAEQNERAGKLV